MEKIDAVTALAALAQDNRLDVFRLLVKAGPDGMAAGEIAETLGLAPNKRYKINATASAILMDTKTGYIYGAIEETENRSGLTIAWGSSNAIEASRKAAERAAFEKLLASFEPFWNRIYNRFHK